VKYPKAFRRARYAVLSKLDLLPHVPFSVERAVALAQQVNPDLQFFFTSAMQDEGLEEWYSFLRAQRHGRTESASAA
jgi:hydrogenase nickel incorporation protein HypB